MSAKVNQLRGMLKQSLRDSELSRTEKYTLKNLIAKTRLSNEEHGLLLSKVRDMVLRKVECQKDLRLLEWFYEAVKIIQQSQDPPVTPSRAYFSPGNACRDAICKHLSEARQSIAICVFTLSDDIIAREVLEAHRLGKSVRLITDNDKAFDMGSDIRHLIKSGVPARTDRSEDHMHHKFAVIDEEVLITGSYNWTRSAAERNFENILVTYDEPVVNDYQKEFEKLWKKWS